MLDSKCSSTPVSFSLLKRSSHVLSQNKRLFLVFMSFPVLWIYLLRELYYIILRIKNKGSFNMLKFSKISNSKIILWI